MRRFFTDFEYKEGIDTLTISGDEAKHILRVLRFKVGDKLIMSNYKDCSFESEILESDSKSCTIKLLNRVDISNKNGISISVFQGYPKQNKLELIVQKLTEIGVENITPILTNRVNFKTNLDKFKFDRLNRIAREACKQCGSSSIPDIGFPVKLIDLSVRDMCVYDLIIVLYEREEISLKSVLREADIIENVKRVCVFIGPEGGFEEEEVNFIKGLGGKSVSLGNRILRTETSAIVISSILRYEFGNMGNLI